VPASPDIVIIGSGMGGATVAAGLAPSGASILILERGERIEDTPETRDVEAIFGRGHFRPAETWHDPAGTPFNPGNYYYVGGNTKLYGAVLLRYRAEDFVPRDLPGGAAPGWPITYDDLELWYGAAEALYRVRGRLGDDPTEPRHSTDFPHPPVPDEPVIAETREKLRRAGLHPFSLPLGVDIETWLKRAATPWDAYPDARTGKMDAETCGLAAALAHDTVRLETGARVERLEAAPDGRIAAVVYRKAGEEIRLTPRLVILAAGAVNSALLLLRSGLANRSDQVGRNFMNHNSSAMLAIDPRRPNTSVYQKTLGLNDFYLDDGRGGGPLGNVQLLGKISGPILKSQMRRAPRFATTWLGRHSTDWYLMSEDLPTPESRVFLDGDRVVLDWRRSNWAAHLALVARWREVLKSIDTPIVLSRPFDRRTPSHQCGTIRMGADPARAPVSPDLRAWDHANLYVVDASVLPTSAAVNPSLTVAALALRAADHIRRELNA
jgi:choline dehydrogenase-like flavoprotein